MCLGIPGKISAISDTGPSMAIAEISGIQREVSVACVLEKDQSCDTLIGKWVLIHVGFAMAIIDEDEAAKTLDALQELGETQEALEQMSQSDKALRGVS